MKRYIFYRLILNTDKRNKVDKFVSENIASILSYKAHTIESYYKDKSKYLFEFRVHLETDEIQSQIVQALQIALSFSNHWQLSYSNILDDENFNFSAVCTEGFKSQMIDFITYSIEENE